MAETRSERSETTRRRGNTTEHERIERTTIQDNTPRRAYKLRPGMRHTQDGFPVAAGDEVMLTREQSIAFADKFVPVDEDGEFEVGEYEAYRPGQQNASNEDMENREYGDGEEGDVERGHPVPTPAIPAGPGSTVGPHGTLKDPTALSPHKQGQQTNEQRRIIDSGQAPPANLPTEVPSPEEQRMSASGREGQTDEKKDRSSSSGASQRGSKKSQDTEGSQQ